MDTGGLMLLRARDWGCCGEDDDDAPLLYSNTTATVGVLLWWAFHLRVGRKISKRQKTPSPVPRGPEEGRETRTEGVPTLSKTSAPYDPLCRTRGAEERDESLAHVLSIR